MLDQTPGAAYACESSGSCVKIACRQTYTTGARKEKRLPKESQRLHACVSMQMSYRSIACPFPIACIILAREKGGSTVQLNPLTPPAYGPDT